MIVAIGLDVDPTFAVFVAAAREWDAPLIALNLRAAVEGEWRIPMPPCEPAQFWYANQNVELHPEYGYFCRIVDLSSEQRDPVRRCRWLALISALDAWLEQLSGRVANRPLACSHNGSKPFHEVVLAGLGFRVPPSITSCDLAALRDFVREGPTVSKSISGVRADSAVTTENILETFDPAGGPIHLQRRITGDDVRIHVIGNDLVAQRVPGGGGVDYRRERRFGELDVFDPPGPLRAAVVRASADLTLPLAGWDFKVDAEGEYWCLEVNPMPGYSAYDAHCGGTISRALLSYLGEETR